MATWLICGVYNSITLTLILGYTYTNTHRRRYAPVCVVATVKIFSPQSEGLFIFNKSICFQFSSLDKYQTAQGTNEIKLADILYT